jgi:hypothetical protein
MCEWGHWIFVINDKGNETSRIKPAIFEKAP